MIDSLIQYFLGSSAVWVKSIYFLFVPSFGPGFFGGLVSLGWEIVVEIVEMEEYSRVIGPHLFARVLKRKEPTRDERE